ncbi:hypothetical protein AJ79_04857 [Helicocarpus griseus UAMH5409]|uniref:Uncharacterized protein n=1 Tax=Helicocarpus griseus UAMH5409 TaxID=1447875 RepID=A0A2B7XS75_9EURO|nr:hypothetical protein AJ79_04857 [Helicocarpus griseus UAMH5409]
MPTTSPKPPTSDWDDRCIPVTHEKVHSTVMGIPLKDASSKKRHDTRKQCYLGLKALISNLEEIPNRPVLDQAEQQRLGICTELSVEPKNASCFDHEVRFFTPSLPENLPFPPCRPSLWGDEQGRSYHESVWPRSIPHDEDAAELVEDYYDGWHLANVITHHVDMLRWKYPTAWQQTW